MFWTDPNQYGASFFREGTNPVAFTPWAQDLRRFTAYNQIPFQGVTPFTPFNQIPFQGVTPFTPYNQIPFQGVTPFMPFNQVPFQGVTPFTPFNQVPFQGVTPFLPYNVPQMNYLPYDYLNQIQRFLPLMEMHRNLPQFPYAKPFGNIW